MIIRERDYVEHFGIRGMKWGVRSSNRDSSADSPSTSSADRKKKIKRGAAIVGGAAAVAAGALLTRKFLKSNGHQTVRDMQRSLESGLSPGNKKIEDLLNHQALVMKYTKLLVEAQS